MMNVQIKGFCFPEGMKLHRSKVPALFFMNLMYDTGTGVFCFLWCFFVNLYCTTLKTLDTQLFEKHQSKGRTQKDNN